ncbi:hypothetical protein COCNU_08G000130 [Cocos nucifera]|uniref:Uncharacterized protein n=1 Tax=Cocos nucifera TaxID=13894 RepID=A0A8K0IH98_COCNU|nr:hypothetical protein COCNU_08G000130 [Cocos nucifera]
MSSLFSQPKTEVQTTRIAGFSLRKTFIVFTENQVEKTAGDQDDSMILSCRLSRMDRVLISLDSRCSHSSSRVGPSSFM